MSIDPIAAVLAVRPSPEPQAPAKITRAAAPAPVRSAPEPAQSLPQARQYQVNASFGEANLIIYRILDKQTGDLIQQIPPEQLLRLPVPHKACSTQT
ncbi:MAG: hypothetical protein DMG81_09945 [Acidobacteria bacterium]|nr:MAG: hypothetical protein DMG81_09945 [Acidobacteriota bacterium]